MIFTRGDLSSQLNVIFSLIHGAPYQGAGHPASKQVCRESLKLTSSPLLISIHQRHCEHHVWMFAKEGVIMGWILDPLARLRCLVTTCWMPLWLARNTRKSWGQQKPTFCPISRHECPIFQMWYIEQFSQLLLHSVRLPVENNLRNMWTLMIM